MAFTAFREMKPFAQFMFALFVMVVSFLAFMLLSILNNSFLGMASLMAA